MRIGVAEARRRFREILDRVDAGEVVEISRRGDITAMISPPSPRRPPDESFGEALRRWRSAWDVDDWSDDDPFADVRDRSEGRSAPW